MLYRQLRLEQQAIKNYQFENQQSIVPQLQTKIRLAFWRISIKTQYFLKRCLDIGISLTMLILLSPLFLLVAILIRLESPGAVLFSQTRIGLNGKPFRFWKFRSMRKDAEFIKKTLAKEAMSDGIRFKLKKDPRITRVGAVIRKFSIDELPQIWNVLIGDMSLVGPRPALPDEVAGYTAADRQRLSVMPGITCIWQVSGRSEIPFKQQVKLDVQYKLTQSLFQDIKLLFLTIPAVTSGKGAY